MHRTSILIICIILGVHTGAFAFKAKTPTNLKSTTGRVLNSPAANKAITAPSTASMSSQSAKKGNSRVSIESIQVLEPTTDCQSTWKVWIKNDGKDRLTNLQVSGTMGMPWAGAGGKTGISLEPNFKKLITSRFTRSDGISRLKISVRKNNAILAEKMIRLPKPAPAKGKIGAISVQPDKWTATIINQGSSTLCDATIQCLKAKSSDNPPHYFGAGGGMVKDIGAGKSVQYKSVMNLAPAFSQGFDLYKFVLRRGNVVLAEKAYDTRTAQSSAGLKGAVMRKTKRLPAAAAKKSSR